MEFEKFKNIFKFIKKDHGSTYWQPKPANGFSEIKLSPEIIADLPFSCGIQSIAPNSYIRKHSHPNNIEVLFFFSGHGVLEINNEQKNIEPEDTVFIGPLVEHKIINNSQQELKMYWFIMPNGLEIFFEKIGRKKNKISETAPLNFDRPDNVEEIEKNTVFSINTVKGK
jgi:mannose-6-phosphate isomerase-like protein (cupin superfamily)